MSGNKIDINRLRQILSVFAEEGHYFILHSLKLKKFLPIGKRLIRKNGNDRHEVKLRKALEKLGPTFIKLGQMLSVRPDLVPKAYIHELEKLQDSVKPFPFSDAKKIVESGTGKKISETFSSFEKKPIASASISQVHKAVLKDGSQVAVKVKRPQIETIIEKDLRIMRFVAEIIDTHMKQARKYKPKSIVDEFSDWTRREIDFNIEADNINRFYENFSQSKTTKIPKVYEAGKDFIIMEYIDGIELHKAKLEKDDMKEAISNGFYSILEQVFVYGLFHADPHPSNILVMKDNKIGFVDFGITGRFDDELRSKAIELFMGISECEPDKVVDTLLELGEANEGTDIRVFRDRVEEIIYPLKNGTLKNVKMSRMLEEVLDLALDFGVKMPREFVLFGKAIVTIEGIGLMYYPDFRFTEMAMPFMEKMVEKKYEPGNMLVSGLRNLVSLRRTLEKLPKQTSRVLDNLEKGRIKIEMKDKDVERLSFELDKSSNRVSYGMIIAALLVSGSLLVSFGKPVIWNISLISTILFSFAAFLGIILIISIFNEGGRQNEK